MALAQLGDERLDVLGRLGRGVVEVLGFADDEAVHRLFFQVVVEEWHQFVGLDGGQSRRNQLQFVGHRKARTLSAIVNCHYSAHIFCRVFEVQNYIFFCKQRHFCTKKSFFGARKSVLKISVLREKIKEKRIFFVHIAKS